LRRRRSDGYGHIGEFRLNNQAIALARDGLDIKRLVRGVAESLAQLVYGGVYVGVVIDMGIRGPQAEAQFIPGDHLTMLFDKGEQNLIDLALQFEASAILADFLTMLVDLKRSKADITRG